MENVVRKASRKAGEVKDETSDYVGEQAENIREKVEKAAKSAADKAGQIKDELYEAASEKGKLKILTFIHFIFSPSGS